MAAVAPIVINDSVPAAHTFNPSRQSGDLFTWTDRSAGVAAGFRVISVATRYSAPNNAGHKVTVKVTSPTLAVTAPSSGSGVQPNPTEAYHTFFNGEFILPDGSDLLARKDLYAYVKNLVSTAFVQGMIENLDAPY